ncbi:hypothetical protein AB0J21_04430 [Streptomyces sp. NPDC049954]|uniref:hypothetical protein n=1 Tax=Streptomyces sp. NPDC049954 TaxID=3155779 RepID=UPI0034361227
MAGSHQESPTSRELSPSHTGTSVPEQHASALPSAARTGTRRAVTVPRPARSDRPSRTAPAPLSTPERLAALNITETDCRQCGTVIAGLNGRYACPLCGWANAWSDGDE